MPANLVATRIADFLRKYPPFVDLEEVDLERLSAEAIVSYFSTDDYVFHQGDKGQEYLFVVQEGVIHLELGHEGSTSLVDICDEGELFGVRAMLSGKPYAFHARCAEESLVYALPISIFKEFLKKNSKIALFFASGLAAGQIAFQVDSEAIKLPHKETGSILNWNRPLSKPSKSLITATLSKSIQEVAIIMTKEKIGSILVCDENNNAVGIVTDTDFRSKLGTGKSLANKLIGDIMTAGVVSMPLGLPLSHYLLEMLRKGIRHICLTSSGKPIGILSEHDLLSSQQNHPLALVYTLEQSSNPDELVAIRNQADQLISYYLDQNVSISLVSSLITHINDMLITRFIELTIAEIGDSPVPFCWISLGSEGRKEQLIRTDQDNAIIFENVADENLANTQRYFIKLAQKVNQLLEKAGFAYCPADMMASNEKWCQPISVWKAYFSGWINEPLGKSLMLSTIFFDFRKIFGDDQLVKNLQNHLNDKISNSRIFLNFLGANALKNPAPLSFFKNFMVERSGEHKDKFDIKARAMMPLTDLARLLVLSENYLKETNTAARFRWLAEQEPKNKALYLQAAESYEYLMKFRALNGFEKSKSKRYIEIATLNKLDRLILRNTFEPIHKLQQLVTVRFQLDYFN